MSDVFRTKWRELTEDEKLSIELIMVKATELHDFIEAIGHSRYTSLAKTALEESVMWAVKQLTREGIVPPKSEEAER